jgi:ribosomal protein S18 acetylase RimI-like enzyme
MSTDIVVTPFDYGTLLRSPNFLRQLAETYCNLWMYDPHFGEYRKCPACQRYFDQHQVEQEGVRHCSNGHPETELIPGWVPAEVAKETVEQSQVKGFYGCVAAGLELSELVGFAWAREIPAEEVASTWGSDFLEKLQARVEGPYMYFDELAVIPQRRGEGIGKLLAINVATHMRDNYPDRLFFLRTHENSSAVGIYEELGFETIGPDTQHGDGRIMMCLHPCSSLHL